MTTRIEVDFGRASLLERNRRQTDANRLAQQDKTGREAVAKDATEQRNKANPVPDDTTRKLQPLDKKPAASRTALSYVPAIGFYKEDYAGDNSVFTFYSGDGKQSISKTVRVLPRDFDFPLKWGLTRHNNFQVPDGPMDWGAAGPPDAHGMGSGWPYAVMYKNGNAVGSGSGDDSYAKSSPSGVRTLRSTQRNPASSDVYQGLYCLPLGKDSFVLYHFYYQYFSQAYVGYKIQQKEQIKSVGTVNVGDYYFGQTGTGVIYAADKTETIADQFSEFHEDEVIAEHCFLVTKTSIKQIAVPPGLTTMVGRLYPQLTKPVPMPKGQLVNYLETRQSLVTVGTPPSLVNTSAVVAQLSPTVNDYQAYANLIDPAQGDVYAEVETRPLAGYGIGRLSTWNHFRWREHYFTPAVYDLFDNGAAIRAEPGSAQPDFENYSHLYATYLAGGKFKSIYLDIDQEGYPFLKGKPKDSSPAAQPVDVFTEVPANLFKRNLRASYPLLADAEPIFVWDWGDSGYCRSKALSLGFSSADLTP